jgi:hypothetical protein
MRHVFFALFDRSEPAAEAIRELRQIKREYPRAPMELQVQRGGVTGENLPLYATNGRRRLIFGVANGLFWGALVGVLLFVGGIATASLGILLAFTSLLGAVIGALGGVLTGVSAPDEALENLAGQISGQKDVSISFSTSDDDFFTRAQDVFVGNGARLQKRAAV